MEMISPVNAETCGPYMGRPVCAVLHDGSRYFGYLHSIDEQKLTLRMEPSPAATSSAKKKRKLPVAKTKAAPIYPAYGYYPPRHEFILDLALIALLFTVPFLW